MANDFHALRNLAISYAQKRLESYGQITICMIQASRF